MPPSKPLIIQILECIVWGGGASCLVWLIVRIARRQQLLPIEPREQVPWTGVDVIFLLIVTMLAGATLVRYGFDIFGVPPPQAGDVPTSTQFMILVGSTATMHVIVTALALGLLHGRVGATARDFGLPLTSLRRDIVAGAIAFLASAPILFGLQLLFDKVFGIKYVHPIIQAIHQQRSAAMFAVTFISAVIVAPFAEEFLFRVLLQGWLEKWEASLALAQSALNPNGASSAAPRSFSRGSLPIGITSFVFALLHLGHGAAAVPLFLFSIVLGFLYQRTHRVWPSVVAHFALNLLTFVTIWLSPAPVGN